MQVETVMGREDGQRETEREIRKKCTEQRIDQE